ncbi:MAG: hypothetical protein ACXAC5_01280 [Promethearchaeota archaeon]|jgi:hypothetical protein
MREVKAIAVYQPSDPWENAIQDAAKQMTGNWLSSHPCQLISQVVASLKLGTDWLERDDLLPIRASYLFNPQLVDEKQKRVFVTHLLFLRDVLENREIDENLHQPIAFLSVPLAHFLFRNCPVHIYVNEDLLRAANPKADFLDVGGFLVAREGTVEIKDGVISEVRYYGSQNAEEVQQIVRQVQEDSGLRFMKAAAREIEEDVFEVSEHFKDIRPDSYVWDKINRDKARILEVEPGETGVIFLKYLDGKLDSIPKPDFDCRFIII